MSDHNIIPIHSEQNTGNLQPILHQIRHALEQLLQTGETTIIDLAAMPLSDEEQSSLLNFLGTGEVSAELNILGKSRIVESLYSGVWLIHHLNDANETDRLFIEVDTIPTLLCAQREDISGGLSQLQKSLAEFQPDHHRVEKTS